MDIASMYQDWSRNLPDPDVLPHFPHQGKEESDQ